MHENIPFFLFQMRTHIWRLKPTILYYKQHMSCSVEAVWGQRALLKGASARFGEYEKRLTHYTYIHLPPHVYSLR